MAEQAEKSVNQPGSPLLTSPVLDEALASENVSWELLLNLGMGDPADPTAKALQDAYLLPVIETFKKSRGGGEVDLFRPIGGVYALRNGEFRWAFVGREIHFDACDAWPLSYKIEALAEEAREWWPPEPAQPDAENSRNRLSAWVNRFLGKDEETRGFSKECWPHLARAYGLATWVMGAMQRENPKHPANPGADLPAPSDTFKAELASYEKELTGAQARFRDAAQRTAQSRYWRGTLVGAMALTVLCAVLGGIFWWRGTEAAYGVAIPAGALGAMVSLLQRMSSGKLVLDLNAGRNLLEVFGAVRPFIGAVFGLAVTALLAGGIVPAIEIPEGREFAFFAGVGFLAGFNERWAQDMLTTSTGRLQASPRESGEIVELTAEGG